MTPEELKEQLKNYAKAYNKWQADAKAGTITIATSLEGRQAEAIFGNIITNYTNNMIESFTDFQSLGEKFTALGADENKLMDSILSGSFGDGLKYTVTDPGVLAKIDDVKSSHGSALEKLTVISTLLGNDAETIKKCLSKSSLTITKFLTPLLPLTTDAAIEASVDKLYKATGYVPADKITKPYAERCKATEVSPVKDVIDELKKTASKEDLAILAQAEELSKGAGPNETGRLNPLFEGAAKEGEANEMSKALAYLKKQGIGDTLTQKQGSNSYDLAKGADLADAVTPMKTTEFHFSPEVIASLQDIYRSIKDVNPNGTGMEAFDDAQSKLEDAVKSKNMDQIREATQKFAEVTKKYDAIFTKLHDANKDFRFQCNLSFGRNDIYPERFRNDVLGASRLSELSNLLKTCEATGVSFDTFLNNPMDAMRKMGQKMVELNPVNDWMQNQSLSTLMTDISQGDYVYNQKFMQFSNGLSQNVGVAFGVAATYCKPEEIDKMVAYRSLFNLSAAATLAVNPMGMFNGAPDTLADTLANLMALESGDRNVYNVIPEKMFDPATNEYHKKFDVNEYIKSGRTTSLDVVARMTDTLVHTKFGPSLTSDIFVEACKRNAAALLDDPLLNQSIMGRKICGFILGDKADKLTETDLKTLKNEAAFLKDGQRDKERHTFTLADNEDMHIRHLYEMKQDYKSRSMGARFLAVFGVGDAGRLRNSIKDMESKLGEQYGYEQVKIKLEALVLNPLEHGETEEPENAPVQAEPEKKAEEAKLNKEAYDSLPKRQPYAVEEAGMETSDIVGFDMDDYRDNVLDKTVDERDFEEDVNSIN